MAIHHLYLFSCMLLLACSCRTSSAVPVRAMSAERYGRCSLLFKDLLLNLTQLRDSDVICYAIISDSMVVSTDETVNACAPNPSQNPGCMMQRDSAFSESECLRNIMKDLDHYAAAIKTYINSVQLPENSQSPVNEVPLLSATLGIIQSLRENCSPQNAESISSQEDVRYPWKGNSYTKRQEMCKMMRGFHVRAITFNRAMGYISSGEHEQ